MVTKPSLFISAPLITERGGCMAAEWGSAPTSASSASLSLCSVFDGQDQGSGQLCVGTNAPHTKPLNK